MAYQGNSAATLAMDFAYNKPQKVAARLSQQLKLSAQHSHSFFLKLQKHTPVILRVCPWPAVSIIKIIRGTVSMYIPQYLDKFMFMFHI